MIKYQVPVEHYFRMYNKVFDLNLKAPTFLVYAYLLSCAGSKGYCWPSLGTISRKTGLSVSTVQEHLKILEQRHLISKSHHRHTGGIAPVKPVLRPCTICCANAHSESPSRLRATHGRVRTVYSFT